MPPVPSKRMPWARTTSSGSGTTGIESGAAEMDEPELGDFRVPALSPDEDFFSVEVPDSDPALASGGLKSNPAHTNPSPILRRTMMPPRARCCRSPGTRLPDARPSQRSTRACRLRQRLLRASVEPLTQLDDGPTNGAWLPASEWGVPRHPCG